MKNLYTTAYSSETNIEKALSALKLTLGNDVKLLMFFASSSYEPSKLSSAFSKHFPGITIVGCSTAGEIVTGKMLDNSIVAMGFSASVISDHKVEIVKDIKKNKEGVKRAFKGFEDHFKLSGLQMDHTKFVGIILTDGLSGTEEMIMDKIGDITDVTFIGGSTGDDLKFKATTIFHNGLTYENASLLLLMKPVVPFAILKTQSFKSTRKKLVVTKVIEGERKVLEFNNKPATVAYAEALGVAVKDLDQHMFKNPLGLMADSDNPFVRSPRIIDGTAMYFYCSVKEGMELELLNSTDILKDTERALKETEKELGKISAIINFNCILRTLDLKQQNKTKEYGELFNNVPTVGFSTYGESYIGHINQTATMLVFK